MSHAKERRKYRRFKVALPIDCNGIHFKSEGWYQGDGDTLLITRNDNQWRLFGWENRDPRPKNKVLDLTISQGVMYSLSKVNIGLNLPKVQ